MVVWSPVELHVHLLFFSPDERTLEGGRLSVSANFELLILTRITRDASFQDWPLPTSLGRTVSKLQPQPRAKLLLFLVASFAPICSKVARGLFLAMELFAYGPYL